MSDTIAMNARDCRELQVALPIAKGAIKNARRLLSALERPTDWCDAWDEALGILADHVAAGETSGGTIPVHFRHEARVALALLDGRMEDLEAEEVKLGADAAATAKRRARLVKLQEALRDQTALPLEN